MDFKTLCAAALSGLALPLLMATPAVGQEASGDWDSGSLTTDGPVAAGVIDLTRLTGPIELDGSGDEPAWASVQPLLLTMYEPTFRGNSGRRIEVRVAYNDEALYVAGRFYHNDPSDIRAFSLTRDKWQGDDGFGILLDTFNDNENALRFVALPLGARMDMSITGDGQDADGGGGGAGTGPRNSSWNTFWDLETQFTDDGWSGEMRIPFSSLRFETGDDGAVVMGMMAYAYEPARGTRWTFPAIPPTSPYTQVSAMQDVRLQGVKPRNPVYVSPYVLSSSALSTDLNLAGDAYVAATNRSAEFGGDIKINPTPNLTVDLTVNTDFAAVEADQQQVNLTRFSLFFDEKRPFFQERAGIFAFATGADQGTLFYSRRIGLADGQPVRLFGGARMVGRVGSWDVGLINMQTGALETDALGSVPGENFGVLRLRRRVFNPNSFIGGMGTTRFAGGGLYNVTYGVDSQFRLFGDEYLTLKWLQTLQGGSVALNAEPGGLDAGRVVFDWTRRRVQGFSYQNGLTWSGPGYNPGVGFEPRQHFLRAQSDWNYQWFPGQTARFRRVWLGAENNLWRRGEDGRVDTSQLKPFLQFETKPGATLKLSMTSAYEDVPLDFELSDEATIPAGSYWATEGAVEFRAPRGWWVRPNVTFTAGQFFDGSRVGVSSNFQWAVNRYLQLGGGWEWNRIRFDERAQNFNTNLLRLRAEGAVNTELSMNAFVQYNSLNGAMSTNARVRYNFREGQDLWLVWNEGLNLDRDILGVPRLPFEAARTLTVKYTHTLVF